VAWIVERDNTQSTWLNYLLLCIEILMSNMRLEMFKIRETLSLANTTYKKKKTSPPYTHNAPICTSHREQLGRGSDLRHFLGQGSGHGK
jgi:hypothetical protein